MTQNILNENMSQAVISFIEFVVESTQLFIFFTKLLWIRFCFDKNNTFPCTFTNFALIRLNLTIWKYNIFYGNLGSINRPLRDLFFWNRISTVPEHWRVELENLHWKLFLYHPFLSFGGLHLCRTCSTRHLRSSRKTY